MRQTIYNAVSVLLLGAMLGWVIVSETNRHYQLAELKDAQKLIKATEQSQRYAEPIIILSQQLGEENVMLREIAERARQLVIERTEEMNRAKEALQHSVKLLSDQIDDNNKCIEHIRKLDRFIKELLKKIPERNRPKPPEIDIPDDSSNSDDFLWELNNEEVN